jgi:hypothetical protein
LESLRQNGCGILPQMIFELTSGGLPIDGKPPRYVCPARPAGNVLLLRQDAAAMVFISSRVDYAQLMHSFVEDGRSTE